MRRIVLDKTIKYGKWKIIDEVKYRKSTMYKCVCDCGTESIIAGTDLRKNRSVQCKKCAAKLTSERECKDLTGEKFGKWEVISRIGTTKYRRPIWLCKCDCGRTGEIPSSNLLTNSSQKCGFCNHYKGLKARVWASIKNSAKTRNIEFLINKEEAWELWEKQKGLCSLTGIELTLPNVSNEQYTASLDRINNNIGYTKDNCQWVHKIVNRMKYTLNNQEFISIAYSIINQHKENPNIDWNKTTYFRHGPKNKSKNYENGINNI